MPPFILADSLCPSLFGAAGEIPVALVTRTPPHIRTLPRINAVSRGTGDMFSAALSGHRLNRALERDAAVRARQQIKQALRRTKQARSAELPLPASSDDNDHALTHEHLSGSRFGPLNQA